MGIMQSPQSQWAKEMAKWEMRPVRIGDSLVMPLNVEEGGRCINGQPPPFEEYPKSMYRAERSSEGGGIRISASCIAHNESDERLKFGAGWRPDQQAALDLAAHEEQEVAILAANRNWNDRNMSAKAKAESQAAEEQSARHLGEIKEKPKRKYQRKAQKAEAVNG